jgi:hypothetical protein
MNDELPVPPLTCRDCHNELSLIVKATRRIGEDVVRFKYTCEHCGSHPYVCRAILDLSVADFSEKERLVWEAVKEEQIQTLFPTEFCLDETPLLSDASDAKRDETERIVCSG